MSKKTEKAVKRNLLKERRTERRAATSAALDTYHPAAGAAYDLARSVSKKASGKKGNFWSFVGGTAKILAELAPLAAPLLLDPSKGHAGTVNALARAGANANTAAPGVPLAASGSCLSCTGIYSMSSRRGADGRVVGVTMRGMDALGSLTVDGDGAGAVLKEIDLNPRSRDWEGTALQRFGTLFERYRPRRIAALIEPACAATTAGAVVSYIDPDPDDKMTRNGQAAIQVAASHQGADISQVWATNAASYSFDKRTQDFYFDPDGSDKRLLSPGTWRVLANTLMPAATTIGSLFVAWEFDFSIPQLEEETSGGQYAVLTGTTTATAPFGTGTWDSSLSAGDLKGQLAAAGTKFTALPAGRYVMWYVCSSVTGNVGAWTITATSDLNNNYLITDSHLVLQLAAGTNTVWYIEFTVDHYTEDDVEGFIQFAFSASDLIVSPFTASFYNIDNPNDSLARKMTLQDYEAQMSTMARRLALCEESLAHSNLAATYQRAAAHVARATFGDNAPPTLSRQMSAATRASLGLP